ncbi:MAG: flagellar export protein FliJ [Lachnospiraceae bacterium]|nr:flagellar export protein FliJ [Lachnospiraceae bacterium]MCR5338392.1 flagellar export protein FliJ [Lachnospiraceae bacterium]
MARFRYRMQNILTVKEKLETQAKNEYAAANVALAEEEEKLEQLKQHAEFLEQEARRLVQQESLSIRDIEDNKLSRELQKEAIAEQKKAIKRAEQVVEEKRLAMVELMQDVKTHEILKDRAFQEFLQEEKAEESKQIDELTSYTYGQKKQG